MALRKITPPRTHPHVARITVDPADVHRLEQRIENSRELRLLDVDDDEPDQWTLSIGCASERVREAVEDGWG